MKIDTIEALKILTYLQPILHKTELALERAKRERGYVVESELYVYRKGCAGLNSTYLFYKHPLTAYKATVFYWKTEAERCAGENYNENYDTDIRLVVTSASKFFQKAYDLLVNIYRFYEHVFKTEVHLGKSYKKRPFFEDFFGELYSEKPKSSKSIIYALMHLFPK